MYFFLLLLMRFLSRVKIHCQLQGPRDVSLFSPQNFMVLALPFMPSIHFVLVFVYGMRLSAVVSDYLFSLDQPLLMVSWEEIVFKS